MRDPRELREMLRTLQAGEMTVSRAIEIMECWQAGVYSDDMLPPIADAMLVERQPEHQPATVPTNNKWWCPQCKVEVPPEHVTYIETHDSRCGGCGCGVLSTKPVNEPTEAQLMSEDYIRGYDAGFIVGAEKGRSGPTEALLRRALESLLWASDLNQTALDYKPLHDAIETIRAALAAKEQPK